jgi:hypothetical protein
MSNFLFPTLSLIAQAVLLWRHSHIPLQQACLAETIDTPKFALERVMDLKTTKCHDLCATKGMGFVPLAVFVVSY